MATTDVFNNPSNDYVNPDLSPCAGTSDSAYFEFFKDGAGVISGSKILSFLDLSNISIPVTSWSLEKKTLQSGEVAYVPGLTKGLLNRTQIFDIIPAGYAGDLSKYFMTLDISINFLRGFRYVDINIEAISDYSLNIDIDDAMNIALGNASIPITATYDPSIFSFRGNNEGYSFQITNAILTISDVSANNPFPSYMWGEQIVLNENVLAGLPSAKYPNGGMLGYVLKTIFPSDQCTYNRWIYMNNVESPFEVFLPEIVTNYITDISTYKTIIFDSSVKWNSFVNDVSIIVPSFSCVSTGYTYDPSYGGTPFTNQNFNGLIIDSSLIWDSSIINSVIIYSGIRNSKTSSNSGIYDSSIYSSDIWDDTGFPLAYSTIHNSFISDSSLSWIEFFNSIIQHSYMQNVWVEDSSLSCMLNNLYRSTIVNSNLDLNLNLLSNSIIYGSNLNKITLTDSSVVNTKPGDASVSGDTTNIVDSSLYNVNINTSALNNIEVDSGNIYESYIKNSFIKRSYIEDSSIRNTYINSDSSIINSILENSWTNAFELIPGLWTNDVSCVREYITGGFIHDSSINNTTLKDVSIYTSHIYDSSIINCTLYNVILENSSVQNSITVEINVTCDVSMSWDEDTSTFYNRYMKIVNVGMNGGGDENTLSAADYLDYISIHNLWDKVGPFASRITTPDSPNSSDKNLIGGFYIFNPQVFPVQVEYMIIN